MADLRLVPDYGLTYDRGNTAYYRRSIAALRFQQLPTRWQQALLPPQTAALLAAKGSATQIHTYHDRDYGVVFELPAVACEQLLGLHDSR
ncbi:MAG: hypothetical protein EOO62_27560 [Hymenobacter sp.]|nr:MAG: hypothetical protein EOO62_27560 [Hymenobacter sp.]